MDDELSESLCARVKEQSKDAILVGLCYRWPKQGKTVAKTFFKQLKKVLGTETLDLMGHFNLLAFSGRATIWDATVREVSGQNQGSTLGRGTQWTYQEWHKARSAIYKEQMVGNVISSIIYCYFSAHEPVDLKILRQVRRGNSWVQILGCRKPGFGSFRKWVDGIPWEELWR